MIEENFEEMRKQQEFIDQEVHLREMMLQEMSIEYLKTLSDEQAKTIPLMYEAWVIGKTYKVGDRIQCYGRLWKCGHEHISTEETKPVLEIEMLSGNSYFEIIK